MQPIALVMAGGAGERMRRSGGTNPKSLTLVDGVSLLERNVHALLRAGLSDITVSVSAGLPEIKRFIQARVSPLVTSVGGILHVLEEQSPLGNIGCARLLADRKRDVLVVFADNLTTLDLSVVVAAHYDSKAPMTLVSHEHLVTCPFGELAIDHDLVTRYREKPSWTVRVCSGIAVLGVKALAILPEDRPSGLVDLCGALLDRGLPVVNFTHNEPWVDVNDLASLSVAEEMLKSHGDVIEQWLPRTAPPSDVALVARPRYWLAVAGDAASKVPIRLPSLDEVRESGVATEPIDRPPLIVDELDGRNRPTRYRVVALRATSWPSQPIGNGMMWILADEPPPPLEPLFRRLTAGAVRE